MRLRPWMSLGICLFFVTGSLRADEHWAASLSPADIQAAANAASDGDTVVLPAGTYVGFNTTVTFKNGVSLRGQGRNLTIIRAGTSYYGVLFKWNTAHRDASSTVEIKDFSLYGPGHDESTYGGGIVFYNSDHMEDFKIHELHIEGFNSEGIRLFKATRGLIYNCTFKNIYDPNLYYGAGISILGDELWDEPKPPLGTADAIFIEDCVFINCKHGVSTGDGSHHVVRYCTFREPVSSRGMSDVHGHYPPPDGGGNTWEIYGCAFLGSDANAVDVGVQFRGGSGVCWSNTFTDNFSRWCQLDMDEHGAYPDPYMVKSAYFWDNTSDGQLLADVAYIAYPSYCKQNREYFMYKKPGYNPYPYPHPMRISVEPLAVKINANPASGGSSLTFDFVAKPTGGVPPYTYSWDFGDGTGSTAARVTHKYDQPGKFRVNLTVTDSAGATASASLDIVAEALASYTLSLSALTGGPAVGQGGTTIPQPGNHIFPGWSRVSVEPISNPAYRFSRWTGDFAPEDNSPYAPQVLVLMDRNRSLVANFCSGCGDLNGDLSITPQDAQRAFDIYMKAVASPTYCELENADVDASGTESNPDVTPADSRAIFFCYLDKHALAGDCSGLSRNGSSSLAAMDGRTAGLTINDLTSSPGETVVVPIIVESSIPIDAFGFDLAYPDHILEFLGLEETALTQDFLKCEARAITEPPADRTDLRYPVDLDMGKAPGLSGISERMDPPDRNDRRLYSDRTLSPERTGAIPGVVRVGGYRIDTGQAPASGVLVSLVFRVRGRLGETSSLSIIATCDDIEKASVRNGQLTVNSR